MKCYLSIWTEIKRFEHLYTFPSSLCCRWHPVNTAFYFYFGNTSDVFTPFSTTPPPFLLYLNCFSQQELFISLTSSFLLQSDFQTIVLLFFIKHFWVSLPYSQNKVQILATMAQFIYTSVPASVLLKVIYRGTQVNQNTVCSDYGLGKVTGAFRKSIYTGQHFQC